MKQDLPLVHSDWNVFSQSNQVSDECVFYVEVNGHKHYVRIWGSENSHETRKVSQ